MNLLNQIILQLFFVLTPFIAFNIYYRDKIRNFSRTFIIIISSVSLFLSMTFASSLVDGIFFDMRYVILFFSLVYGGVQTGLILFIEFVIYRLYLAGEGKWIAIFIMLISFALSLFLKKIYRTTHRKSVIIFFAGIIFSIAPSVLSYYYFPIFVKQHLIFHTFVLPIQTSLGFWLLMSLFSKAVSDKEMFIRQAQNERIQAISQVAASLAHEVRNPLTAVKGFLKLIIEKPNEPVKIKQYAEISLEEIERTEHILTEYLAISKPSTLRTEIINLTEHIQAIYNVMIPFASLHNVELKIHTPGNSLLVVANSNEIKQVLVNFIKNAVEACVEQADGRVIINLIAKGSNAQFSIIDNGVGMSEDQLSRLGSIYYSTKASGNGLGLTYSYQVIHTLGGNIAVSSKVHGGTKFRMSLPLQSEELE